MKERSNFCNKYVWGGAVVASAYGLIWASASAGGGLPLLLINAGTNNK
jgi:hypothetical protein